MTNSFLKRVRNSLFRQLSNGQKLHLYALDDGLTVFVSDGYCGFFLPLEQLLLNPAAFLPFPDPFPFENLSVSSADFLLNETNQFLLVHDELCQRFDALVPVRSTECFSVYLRSSSLKLFKKCSFFISLDSSFVIAVDDSSAPVGIIETVAV